MAAIKVLVVADGPYMDQNPPEYGINLAPAQDLTDGTFTISEFLYLLRNNPMASISVAFSLAIAMSMSVLIF